MGTRPRNISEYKYPDTNEPIDVNCSVRYTLNGSAHFLVDAPRVYSPTGHNGFIIAPGGIQYTGILNRILNNKNEECRRITIWRTPGNHIAPYTILLAVDDNKQKLALEFVGELTDEEKRIICSQRTLCYHANRKPTSAHGLAQTTVLFDEENTITLGFRGFFGSRVYKRSSESLDDIARTYPGITTVI